MDNAKLVEMAAQAREFSCAEISNFRVGAALLTKSGKVFLGCNIEDPSGIGVTNVCGERCAMVKALSEGHRDFEKIAVVGGVDELIFCTPCGVCRQYLNTFCPQIKIVCGYEDASGTAATKNAGSSGVNQSGEAAQPALAYREFELCELLPHSFSEKF